MLTDFEAYTNMAMWLSALSVGRALSLGKFLVLVSVRGSIDQRTAERQEQLRTLKHFSVRFEVFTAVTMKNAVFWDIKPMFVLHRRHITYTLQSSAS
jgi:hypothetical protein